MNSNEQIFYVYQYIRDDGLPYYIGYGHKNRIHELHKNVITPKDKSKRQFVQQGMTEKDALILERQLTEKYGLLRDGTGILENKIHGGHASPRGMLGKTQSQKSKDAIAAGNKGKVRTDEHKENYRKPKTTEHAENIRKAVLNQSDSNRYIYNEDFAHKGKPWSAKRRKAQELKKGVKNDLA